MGNLEKAQKAFAFFVCSDTAESQVALDKLSQLGVSLDDVAYQDTSGAWITRYGNQPFSFDYSGTSRESINREIERQARIELDEQKERQKAQQAVNKAEWDRQAEKIQRQHESERKFKEWKDKNAEHQHYANIISHANDQAAKHEAFERGEGYIGSDGEYHLYSEMKWRY